MYSNKKLIKYSESLKNATEYLLESNQNLILLGLGVPNGAGGTTTDLHKKYPERVFDTPTSEAAITGFALGASISGMSAIVHHDRVEFSLFAADQIFTQASKWNYMFGGKNNVSLTLRIVIGRQWGNGPQHSQSFYSLFGNTIGLKVVIPSSPYNAKGLLIAAVNDPNPVIILEPRWLYGLKEYVPDEPYLVELDKMKIVKEGKDATLVAYGDGVYSAIEAQNMIGDLIDLEIIDLVSLNPIDSDTLFKSVSKTGRLITLDTTHSSFSIGSELVALVAKNKNIILNNNTLSISCPNVPCPTSTSLSQHYYPNRVSICNEILNYFGFDPVDEILEFDELHLSPNKTMPS